MNRLLKLSVVFVCVILCAQTARTETAGKADYQVVPFERLFFKYQPPMDVEHPDGTVTKATGKPMAIPPQIKELNGMKVAIQGYIIPLETDGKNVRTFLFADQLVTCLFCQGLGYDQWIMGTVVNGKGFRLSDDQYEEALTIYGALEVGEQYEEGQLTSIYRIKAESFQSDRRKAFGLF